MKYFLFFFSILYSTLHALGQAPRSFYKDRADKPIIDSNAIKNWPRLDNNISISNNGKHVAYVINRQPYHNNTLVVQSIITSWKKEIHRASPGFFSPDSRAYIYVLEDTLFLLPVGADNPEKKASILSYQHPGLNKGQWIAWKPRDRPDELVVHNLLTNKELHYTSVADHSFNESGNLLLLKLNSNRRTELQLARLPEGKSNTIWSSENLNHLIHSYTFDPTGNQISFIVEDTSASAAVHYSKNSLWYYKSGMKQAVMKADNRSEGIEPGLIIQGAPSFSANGKYILFTLQALPPPKPVPGAVKLDIWHYRDTTLQSTQLAESIPEQYTAVISTEGQKVTRIQRDFETSMAPNPKNFMVYTSNASGDRFWLQQPDSNWLVSLRDGSRKLLNTKGFCTFRFSPDEKYLVYYDAGQNNYFSYHLNTGKLINISASIPAGQLSEINEYQLSDSVQPSPVGIAAWLKNGDGLMVYANYDIWLLDLAGSNPPLNITNDYGRLHRIKFRLIADDENLSLSMNDTLLLCAYNASNKQNGIFRKVLDDKTNPELITMSNQVMYLPSNTCSINHDYDRGLKPIKADSSNAWIVKLQSNTEFPNYYTTSDFKNYKAITSLQPQKAYNWLSAELINYQQLDGTSTQGILYKPENFDPKKKYPVIFNYYEQLSHRLYQYPTPYFTQANINTAWFVSRGYLVFTPDIYFIKGRPGKSALNAVAGAVEYLKTLPYVDGNKMGINGHSVGGGLTNYIITHCNLFAAAIEGAGTSDIVSSSLQLSANRSRLFFYDEMLWENTDSLLEDSPIMHVKKVTTPLIIFHSKSDSAVPWEQAVELYIALRRHGKKCWLLQYDEGNHGVWLQKDVEDYTIRITQFFDHYLKGAPPPMWMTRGIPAKLKGLTTGYELDTSGAQP